MKATVTADIIELARQYGRYGYRKIAGLLRQAGWAINDKRVKRIWRREGLKVPGKQPRRGRLWLADGSCIRLRPQHRDHVRRHDFVEDRTHDGRRYRMLNVLDEFTHECVAIRFARWLKAIDVIDVLSDDGRPCTGAVSRSHPATPISSTSVCPHWVHSWQPNGPPLSYRQWEPWLALYHGKTLVIAVPQAGAPRDQHYVLYSGGYRELKSLTQLLDSPGDERGLCK